MKNLEFKTTQFKDATVYTLESATSGATSAAMSPAVSKPLGKDQIVVQSRMGPTVIPTEKPRNFVAKNAKTGGAGAHKDKKKAEKQGDVKHKNKSFDMAEGFQNDESNLYYRYDPADGRLKQRMVHNNDERQAFAQGFKDTPEQALRAHGIIRSKFNPKKFVQNQGGKWIEVFPFGQQGVAEARGMASVNPYVELMQSLGWFMSMNTAKIAQDAIDSAAQQELKTMQQQFNKPIINGKKFADVVSDPTMFKHPKVAPALLKFAYDMLGYIEPRIKKYVRPELQSKWIGSLSKLKDQYRAAVQFTSGQQGVAEGKEDKIAQLKKDHDTAVHWSKNETSPQKREAARQKAEKIKSHLEKQYKQGVAEGSGPKEKQKTPYRDINSPEYRAAADKQKQRMAKDKAAEPGKKMMAKQGVAEDHEIQMASSELQSIAKNASQLLDLVRKYSEQEGLEAWQQSKITKAADYLNAVLQSVSGEQSNTEDHSDMGKGWGQGAYATAAGSSKWAGAGHDEVQREDTYMAELFNKLQEKIPKNAPVDVWIKDFEKSNAPQFRGKSKEKRRQMAVAASYGAKNPSKKK